MFRYQWRAFWRRAVRTRRIRFYLTAGVLLGVTTAVALPGNLSKAAAELAAGKTATMDRLLVALCALWLVVLFENPAVSLSTERLRRFPVNARSLLALRLLSIFLSPLAWLATIVSVAVVVSAPYAMAVRASALLVGGGAVWCLFLWIFLRNVHGGTSERTARRTTSVARLPGRLGPLVQRELRVVVRAFILWIGLLLVLAAAALALFASLSSAFHETIFVFVCALNAIVTLNLLGTDRPAALTRYLILPISGKDLFLAKNMAVMVVVAVQLMLLPAVAAWQSGVRQLASEMAVAITLILAHLACGNAVSVFEPLRTEPHRFTSGTDPVTAWASVIAGSLPGVAVIALLRADIRFTPWAIAAVVLLTVAAYVGSLRYAGRSFERRIEIVSRILA